MNSKLLTPFSDLPWESRFVDTFPGDPTQDNFTRQVRNVAYSEVRPTAVRSPKLLGWSERLAASLGIARPSLTEDPLSLELLSGNQVLPQMKPYAARYGGHQFGNWAGQLGDGRAITLGERVTPAGRFEFQLKGAGPTPYSRRADGRAVLRSSMREFLCSEAMHFLGIPTTRALSLVSTGEAVTRDLFYDGNPKDEPGAIVCRVSPSFLRFGNFEILAAQGENELLKRLAGFLIQEHFPELNLADPDVFGKLLDEIARRSAEMIAHWMRVGFVHGVMNTDNMSVLGLTIDYGPYGWLESYDPAWTPNTTDAERGRYRFGNQPNIALWNLMRLCEAFYSLIPAQNNQDIERSVESRLRQSLQIYHETFQKTYSQMLAQKFGLASIASQDAQNLVNDCFQLMEAAETDFTLFFRALSDWTSDTAFDEQIASALYHRDPLPNTSGDSVADPMGSELREKWIRWSQRFSEVLQREGLPEATRTAQMKKANPKVVLRNYLAQNAIDAAEKGDLSVMERLLRVLETPYDELPGEEDLAAKRPEWARHAPGCSALSCSS